MLELSYLRNYPNDVIERLKKRNIRAERIISDILRLDEQRRQVQVELDKILSESNSVSKQIGEFFREGKSSEANQLKERSYELKEKSKELQHDAGNLKHSLEQFLISLPNVPHELVKKGIGRDDNEEVERVGDIKELFDHAQPHWELADEYDLIKFDLGVKVAGAGFPVYRGKGARLQRALISFFVEENIKAGYEEYLPPYFANEASVFGTGQLPDMKGQMYHMKNDDLYAIPTAEVPITNFFRDEIVEAALLPIKCTAYTPCFRREAGSYGKDVRGLNRLHQFDKVEIVIVCKPEESYQILDEMLAHIGKLLQNLELPYRILRLCGGDMSFTSSMTYDFEVWSAVQKRWSEVSSVSNFEAFQSNRLKLRYRGEDKKTHLCHTLNGSSLALPRIVAALLENHQTETGITIPEALVPYTGFKKI